MQIFVRSRVNAALPVPFKSIRYQLNLAARNTVPVKAENHLQGRLIIGSCVITIGGPKLRGCAKFHKSRTWWHVDRVKGVFLWEQFSG